MEYKNPEVKAAAAALKKRLQTLENKRSVLRAPELTALYDRMKTLPAGKPRADFGRALNALKLELEQAVKAANAPKVKIDPIDVTAPMDINAGMPKLRPAEEGSKHPLMSELENILEIFSRMGFAAVESREIDDDYHMFGSLNFPKDHPARDDYDTFITGPYQHHAEPGFKTL
jgi:phenylalanyl-tRNA synthetase alpha chain